MKSNACKISNRTHRSSLQCEPGWVIFYNWAYIGV